MQIQNNNSFSYAAQDNRAFLNSTPRQNSERNIQKSVAPTEFKGFSEKAVLTFENLTTTLNPIEKSEAAAALNNIGKAAAYAAVNGYDSQDERLVVNQVFDSFSGVLSDDQIKKMISSKLDTAEPKDRAFLQNFSAALDEPLQRIDIKI